MIRAYFASAITNSASRLKQSAISFNLSLVSFSNGSGKCLTNSIPTSNARSVLSMCFASIIKLARLTLEHEHLFLDQVSRVLKPHDVVSTDPDRLTVDIDLRRKANDVINDIRNLYRENAIERVTREQYPFTGKLRPILLQNRFNALVLKLEDKLSNQEILTHKDNYIRGTEERTKKGYKGRDGKVIYDLIGGSDKSFGAKQILLSVCDGYFVKHPTKTYL